MSCNFTRTSSGQTTAILGLLISVFCLLTLGLFTFEINRVELARQQLKAACDAAGLAAAATLASSDNLNPTASQQTAMQTALTTFQQNSVLGVPLTNASIASSSTQVPLANQGLLSFQLLNPNNNNQVVSLGDPNGKVILVTGTFGVNPAFGKFLSISSIPVSWQASGGVPSMDLVLCFDLSASIDDMTPVTFVRRQWNAAQGKTNYIVASTAAGSPAGALAQGTILNILGPPVIGSPVDGMYPQQLSSSNYPGDNKYPMNFSEDSGGTGAAPGLRGTPNAGSPPGNCQPGRAGTGGASTYTDLVVNIDGNSQFGGTVFNGYNFPDLSTLVEAARGNLENNNVFTSSKASLSVPTNIRPIAGYQAAYFQAAAQNVHPLYDAQVAAANFLTIMNTDANSHFCLVSFNDNAGTSATDNSTTDNIDYNYTAGGTGSFPSPMIALSSAASTTNYSAIQTILPTTRAYGGTNIGDALNTAVTQLKTNSRQWAKQAIVLFTDGEPTVGGPLDNDPATNARKAAVLAQKSSIPIYTIGLAQTAAIIPSETAILNDTNSNPNTGGIAAIAGNGGKFFLVTKVQNLQLTFENIARQLVQLVH